MTSHLAYRDNIGETYKNAPNTTKSIPSNIAVIPMIVVRIAIIVTPVGLLLFMPNSYTMMTTDDLYKVQGFDYTFQYRCSIYLI